jgi:hypothetical protein
MLLRILPGALEPDQVNAGIVPWIEEALHLDAEHVDATFDTLLRGLLNANCNTIANSYFKHVNCFIRFVTACAWPSSRAQGSDFIFVAIRGRIFAKLGVFEERHEDWTRQKMHCNCIHCKPVSQYLQNAHLQTADFRQYSKDRKHVEAQCRRNGLQFQVLSGGAMGLRLTKNTRGA